MHFTWLLVFIFKMHTTSGLETDDYVEKPVKNQVEVRAVFINCEPDASSESETTRFERQELLKHNALRQCNKKLALTVKLASETDVNTGDEYIPIDHVFEGSNKKRVRLLNPYIFRLKRELPVQAYKLRRLDTVSGVLTKDISSSNIQKRNRSQRDASALSEADEWSRALGSSGAVFTLEHNEPGRHSYSVRIDDIPEIVRETTTDVTQASKDCGLRLFTSEPTSKSKPSGPRTLQRPLLKVYERHEIGAGLQNPNNHHLAVKRNTCAKNNETAKREKRYEQNMMIESKGERNINHISNPPNLGTSHTSYEYSSGNYDYDKSAQNAHHPISENIRTSQGEYASPELNDISATEKDFVDGLTSEPNIINKKYGRNIHNEEKIYDIITNEKKFALYEIGDPSLWYKVNVQLFEKMSTPEGKTVWNDLTRGAQATVSTTDPEWTNPDLNLRYRPSEWLTRDDFTLTMSPTTTLCLLMPMKGNEEDSLTDIPTNFDNEEYIVVPIEDVVGLDDKNTLTKRDDNYSDFLSKDSADENEKSHRKVEVRVTRALFGGKGDNFGIAFHGTDRFLTVPHNRPCRAQIDLEVRADDNQLVRVGSSGSINTVVSDSTRKTRSIITIQASNTGLVSSMFRVRARDCGPELSGIINENNSEGTTTSPILLPPRHTRRLRLELPIEMPVDAAHCSVALLNEDDEAVAVRDVAIRKGDRCFCVWHCDCVCLGEDPKLICREMSQSSQVAAGLPLRQHGRHVRSACYSNNVTINLFMIIIGVLLMLLSMGCVKATMGLKCRCIAMWEIGRILQMPRQIPEYYECNLKNRTVEYDDEGWPVHPDTKKRAMPVSWSMLYLLNTIFFIVLPFVVIRDAICKIITECLYCAHKVKSTASEKGDTKKCFSSHDMQSTDLQLRRRRRPGLRRWMSPHAEELSGDLWQRELIPQGVATAETMRPLLQAEHVCRSKEMQHATGDSEQDDTDYVLMQMQKSRESLSRNQKKPMDSGQSSKPFKAEYALRN